ncbi:hypothetical protein KI688_006879 [Linnemannia hyalina]|uniref:K Homology domain-containing protein n=1 Tax=Linnemannia hyalina TaxID=64524 RepID=A0A9P7XJK2_9FUNG|nr:hypothetical protein KI688_006879 [Linnemannia hyalina]
MSDEPRRKRKWDTQGEENDAAAVDAKRALIEEGVQSNGTESPSGAQDTAVAGADQSPADAAAAAAAIAAAKLNAMLVAKGQAPASTTPEINNSGAPAPVTPSAAGSDELSAAGRPTPGANRERDEFFKDIDINDVKHRYILTKGSVQTQIQRDTTADVTTRGKYYPDRSIATEKDPPLYLHVTAMTQEALDLALQKIDELINEAENPAPMPPQRDSFAPPSRMPGGPPPRHHQPFPFQTRVEINMDSERTFNVRAKIVGPGGQYVKHVQNETRTRVKLKGQGSGFLEVESGREAEEPLYISILGNTQEEVDEAERLCKDLVETVRAEYERMKSRPPAPYEPYGDRGRRDFGGRPSYHGNGDSYNRHRDSYDRDRRYDDGRHPRQPYDRPPYDRQPYDRHSYDRQPYDHHRQQQHLATQPHHQYGYNQQYHSGPPPPHGMAAPVNPPLPSGPPPPLPSGPAPPADPMAPAPPTSGAVAATTSSEAGAVVTSEAATSASAAGAPAAAQGYTYDQYEAYNQYYYQQQQQYYQQYGQYYQQAYAQPGAEQGQQGAAGSSATAPVSTDPALAYYGYAYAATAPPGSEATGAVAPAAPAAPGTAGGESASDPPPPPPGAPSSSDSQPPPPQPEASA